MKSIKYILIILLFFGTTLYAYDRNITFGIDSDFPPFSYVANNMAMGYENDLIKLIFEEGDYNLELKYGLPWNEIYNQTTTGQIDICGTLVKTPERAEQVFFTDDAYTRYFGVFTNTNTENINVDDIGDYRLGAMRGYYSEIIIHDLLTATRYEIFDSFLQMIIALKENKIDAFIETTEVVKYHMAKNNMIGQITLQHDGLFPQSVPFGVSKNRPDLVKFINKRLKEIKASDKYEILYIKHFSAHSLNYFNTQKRIYRWMFTGIIIATLLIITLLIILLKLGINKISQKESEIKIKDEELHVSEEKFRTLFESSKDAIFLLDPEKGYLDCNPAALKMFAVNSKEKFCELNPVLLSPEFQPDGSLSSELAKKEIAKAFEAGVNLYEWRHKDLDGREFLATVLSTPIELHGKIILHGSIRDITERKLAEDKLKQSYEFNDSLIKTIPFGMNIVSETGTVLFQSDHFKKIFGENAIGSKCWDLYKDDKKQCSECPLIKGITIGETESNESPGALGNKILKISHTGMMYEGKKAMLEIFQDITEHKRVEEALRDERQRLDGILRGTNVGTWEWNVQTGETIYNERWANIIGYTLEEISPVTIETWRKYTLPDSLKVSYELLEKHFQGEIEYYENETQMKHKNGSTVWVLDRGKVITWTEDGRPLMIMGTIQDITKRKLAEMALLESEEKLRQSQKMEAIGQLAGGMAHDFNNVLSGILSASELLRAPRQGMNEKSLTYVSMIIQASTRASDLIRKLLAFSRKGTIVTSNLDIHQILNDIIAILEGTIDKKITISLTEEAQNQNFIGDISAIESAFINLGINASHAMPDGGTIQIKTKDIYLDQKYCDSSSFEIIPGNFLQIEIIDTGLGIPEENLQKIFDPFFTTKDQGKGTGLGLSAVYGTILDHNGQILVDSEVGTGTTFSILLPCAEKSTEQVKEISPTLTGTGTILLVDDEELNRILNADILESLGYKVLLAVDGLESVEIYSKKHSEIDIVLLDMIMPKMNGTEAFYKMKEIDENCKVIISSGYTQDKNIDELIENGLAGFINKPYKISDISQLLDKVQNKK